MKRRVLWLLCLLAITPLSAQQLPAEWLKYSVGESYLYEVRSDHNDKGTSESLFCENLRQATIVGLAQQIEVQVNSNGTSNKVSNDGRTHIVYQSTSTLSTTTDLQLVQTDVCYNRTTGEGMAIAWIDKALARSHYLNELHQVFSKVEGSLKVAEEYSATGYDKRATAELKESQEVLNSAEGYLSRLSLFGLNSGVLGQLSERHSTLRLAIEKGLKESAHGQCIYFVCSADLFGVPFDGFGSQLKGGLSSDGCNFVSTDKDADWRVVVRAVAREYNERSMSGITIFTSFVDTTLSITNNHTGQVVCTDEVSIKGSHTMSYQQAASTAYGDIQKQLLETINSYIN